MESVILADIVIEFNSEKNKEFYSGKDGFTCDCPDCLNYVDKLPLVKNLINGLDDKLGIDLSKDVGQGMDELMHHEFKDHHLFVIPYYINGFCKIEGERLIQQQNGPIWAETKKAEYKLNENLSILIINTTETINFENTDSVLTLWLEFKTPLIE